MTPIERQYIEKIDQMILHASEAELKKIQEIDLQTQLNGLSFYDSFINSGFLSNNSIPKSQKTRSNL